MGMQRPGRGSKPARDDLIGWSSDGRAEFFAPPVLAPTGLGLTVLRPHRFSLRHFFPLFSAPIFRPTVFHLPELTKFGRFA
jgi:hypothetical protein